MNIDKKALIRLGVVAVIVLSAAYLIFPEQFGSSNKRQIPKEIVKEKTNIVELDSKPMPKITLNKDLEILVSTSREIALSNIKTKKWDAEIREKVALKSRNEFTDDATKINLDEGKVAVSDVEQSIDQVLESSEASEREGVDNSTGHEFSLIIKSIMIPKNGKRSSAYISFNGKKEVLVYEDQVVEGVSITKIAPHALSIVVRGKQKIIPVL